MTDQERIKELEVQISFLKRRVELYERAGDASLFYALNRKKNEIASMLNGVSLDEINMASKNDASFERVFKLLEKSEGISAAAKTLGEVAGITGDEDKDTKTPKYKITTPESIADGIGELAGKRN